MPFDGFKADNLPDGAPPTEIEATLETDQGSLTVKGLLRRLVFQNRWARGEVGDWPDGHKGHRISQLQPGAVMMTYAEIPPAVLEKLGLNADNPLDRIAVSLVAETRQNLSANGLVLCVPGGFADAGESSLSAAQREFHEEVGLAAAPAKPKARNHPEIVPNRNFDNMRDGGRGVDVFVAPPVGFEGLDLANPEEEALALCDPAARLWKHKNLKGQKDQPTFFVQPQQLLRVTPDALAYPAAMAAMNDWENRRKTS